jgi:predicted membrane protein
MDVLESSNADAVAQRSLLFYSFRLSPLSFIDITKVRIIIESTKLFSNFFLNLFSLKTCIYKILFVHLYCLIIKTNNNGNRRILH